MCGLSGRRDRQGSHDSTDEHTPPHHTHAQSSEECKDIIMLDDVAIQRALTAMRLEMGNDGESLPAHANISTAKIEEVQACFLLALVYEDGIVVFRESSDLTYLIVLRALQDNLFKHMEIGGVQFDVAYLALFVIWHLQARYFWPLCAVFGLFLVTPPEKFAPVATLGSAIQRGIRLMFKDEQNALMVREKVRGLSGAVIILQVLSGHPWFAFSWALDLIPVFFAFAATMTPFAANRSFYTIHKIVRVVCRIGLLFVLVFQDFRSYPTLIISGRTFVPELFDLVVELALPVLMFACVIVTQIPSMLLPSHWMMSLQHFRFRRPLRAALATLLGFIVMHWYLWSISQPWWFPIAAVLSYGCYSTLHPDVQAAAQSIVMLAVFLPGSLMWRLFEYLERKWHSWKAKK